MHQAISHNNKMPGSNATTKPLRRIFISPNQSANDAEKQAKKKTEGCLKYPNMQDY
jgi:hypothetical protein